MSYPYPSLTTPDHRFIPDNRPKSAGIPFASPATGRNTRYTQRDVTSGVNNMASTGDKAATRSQSKTNTAGGAHVDPIADTAITQQHGATAQVHAPHTPSTIPSDTQTPLYPATSTAEDRDGTKAKTKIPVFVTNPMSIPNTTTDIYSTQNTTGSALTSVTYSTYSTPHPSPVHGGTLPNHLTAPINNGLPSLATYASPIRVDNEMNAHFHDRDTFLRHHAKRNVTDRDIFNISDELANVKRELAQQKMQIGVNTPFTRQPFLRTPKWDTPSFLGKRGESFEEFESNLKEFHLAMKWPEDEKSTQLRMMLKEKAKQYFKSLSEGVQQHFSRSMDALRMQFGAHNMTSTDYLALLNKVQGTNQNVSDYCYELERNFRMTNVSDEKMKVNFFINGIRPELKELVIRKMPETLEQAGKDAVVCEQSLKMRCTVESSNGINKIGAQHNNNRNQTGQNRANNGGNNNNKSNNAGNNQNNTGNNQYSNDPTHNGENRGPQNIPVGQQTSGANINHQFAQQPSSANFPNQFAQQPSSANFTNQFGQQPSNWPPRNNFGQYGPNLGQQIVSNDGRSNGPQQYQNNRGYANAGQQQVPNGGRGNEAPQYQNNSGYANEQQQQESRDPYCKGCACRHPWREHVVPAPNNTGGNLRDQTDPRNWLYCNGCRIHHPWGEHASRGNINRDNNPNTQSTLN